MGPEQHASQARTRPAKPRYGNCIVRTRYNMQVQSGSGIYFVFVAAVFFLYWASTGSRLARLAVILAANYLFCARFGLFYVLLIPACSSLDFLFGLGLMRSNRPRIRALLVTASVVLNLGILVLSRHM